MLCVGEGHPRGPLLLQVRFSGRSQLHLQLTDAVEKGRCSTGEGTAVVEGVVTGSCSLSARGGKAQSAQSMESPSPQGLTQPVSAERVAGARPPVLLPVAVAAVGRAVLPGPCPAPWDGAPMAYVSRMEGLTSAPMAYSRPTSPRSSCTCTEAYLVRHWCVRGWGSRTGDGTAAHERLLGA
jgi:hypothetical protein